MRSASMETAPDGVTTDGLAVSTAHLDGGYSVCFERHSADADLAPLFAGLPDDRCQLPRWGYVLRGRIGFRFDEGEETYAAGEAYYISPGHTPVYYAGAEIVEFSPTEVLAQTIPVVIDNLRAAGVEVRRRAA